MTSDVPAPEEVAPETSPTSRDERRIRAATDVLRTAVRDFYLAHFATPPAIGPLRIGLTLQINPSDGWALTFDPPFSEQLLPQLAEGQAIREVFRLGHAFCFRCDTSACEHARPLSPREVFRGYDATGRPEWGELAQSLIDAKDERVDHLYAHPARLVALFQYGRALRGRQLAAFGKASFSYSILAQVVAGFFGINGEKLALSLQVVEGRDHQGMTTLRLNPVGYAVNETFMLEWLSAEKGAILFRAMQIAERELARLQPAVAEARATGNAASANRLMARIPGVARRLAEALERGDRQAGRRTRHVEIRRQEQRPVHKAREDALQARPENWYADTKAGTFVVVAARGRAHAFNRDGRHVTSFILRATALDFRIRTGRWRLCTPDEAAAVGAALRHPPQANGLQTNEGEAVHAQ